VYVTNCPGCSKPSPVSIAWPDRLVCDACGYDGPMPEATAARLRAAGESLHRLDASHRQLSRGQRAALSSGCLSAGIYGALACVLGIPALCSMSCGIYFVLDYERADPGALFFAVSGALVLVVTVACAAWITRTRDKLRLAASATPPPVAGAPARCRACAAPLAAGTEAVVRCEFCGADNLVAPEVLGRVVQQRVEVLAGFEERVAADAGDVRRAALRAVAALVVTFVVTPFLVFAGTVVVLVVQSYVERPPHEFRYAIVDTEAGRCVARLTPAGGGYDLTYAYPPVESMPTTFHRDTLDGVEVVALRRLVGRRVTWRDTGSEELNTERIGRIYGTYAGDHNYAELGFSRRPIAGLCLAADE